MHEPSDRRWMWVGERERVCVCERECVLSCVCADARVCARILVRVRCVECHTELGCSRRVGGRKKELEKGKGKAFLCGECERRGREFGNGRADVVGRIEGANNGR